MRCHFAFKFKSWSTFPDANMIVSWKVIEIGKNEKKEMNKIIDIITSVF